MPSSAWRNPVIAALALLFLSPRDRGRALFGHAMFDTLIAAIAPSNRTNPVKLPRSDKLTVADLPFVGCMDFKFIVTDSPILKQSVVVGEDSLDKEDGGRALFAPKWEKKSSRSI